MSRIRSDKLVNRSGTAAPELTYGASIPVGYGLTGAGGINITGVITATSLRGYNSLFGTASSATTTFIVTVASKTSNHRYFGTGSGSAYFIDGIESPFLTLLPGKTYRFNQEDGSNNSHPVLFYYTADKTTQYTTNVTTSGTAGSAGAYTEIVVTDTTPVVLHYQCSNHGYMGNAAQFNSNVVDTPYQINARSDINVTGVVTATTFIGNITGNVTGTATGLSGTPNLNVGVVTASQVNVGSAVTIHSGGFSVGTSDLHSTGLTVQNLNATGVVTATSFIGDGSALTGIDATALKDSGGNVKVQANTSGAVVTGVLTATSFSGDGTNLTNTGSTLSAASGSQRVVLTGQTSGTMTASATSSSLTFNASTGTLSATSFSGSGASLTGIAVTADVRTNSLVVSGVSTFAANNSNRIIVGTNTARAFNSATARIHIEGTDLNTSSITVVRNSNDANEPKFILAKTRGTSVNTSTGISSADSIGRIEFNFTDSVGDSQNMGYIQSTNYRTTTNYGGGLIFAVKQDGGSSQEMFIVEESGSTIFGGGRGTGSSNGVIDNFGRGIINANGNRRAYRGGVNTYTNPTWIGGGYNNGGYGWLYSGNLIGQGGAYVAGGYFVGSHGHNVYGGSCGVVGLGGNGATHALPGSGGFFQPGFTGENGSGGVRGGNYAFGGRSHQYDVLYIDRTGNDGVLVTLRQDGTQEGTISVSGTTVSYNGGHLSRWSQIFGIDPYDKTNRPEILMGTVMTNLDEMCEWITPEQEEVIWTQEEIDRCISIYGQIPDGVKVGDVKIEYAPEKREDNWQLNKTKISDIENDKNVAGVFQSWDDDDDTWVNDYYLAMTGDFIIRISSGITVERGDLLTSAGDGTAKPQSDDIIRSSTIAKVTSNHIVTTYDDGSYCVPCVLMSC